MPEFLKKCGEIRGGKWILSAAMLGAALLIAAPLTSREQIPDGTETDAAYRIGYYTEQLEERIETLCTQIHGIHEAHVLLTLNGSAEYVYAENHSASAADYVILQGSDGEDPLLIQEIYPQIRGVAVVCTRGEDSAVRLAVTELLAAALGIPTSAIRVAGT